MKASQIAKVLGRRGGRARAKRLSSVEKRKIASLGGVARRRSLQAAQRIVDNLRYAAAVSEFQGQGIAIRRSSAPSGPLPQIRRTGS